jgi:hypothetical protein
MAVRHQVSACRGGGRHHRRVDLSMVALDAVRVALAERGLSMWVDVNYQPWHGLVRWEVDGGAKATAEFWAYEHDDTVRWQARPGAETVAGPRLRAVSVDDLVELIVEVVG